MLQTIGRHIQGWIAWVVVILVAAAFILFGLEYYLTSNGGKQSTVATVNGVPITAGQLKNTYEALERNYTQQGMALNERMQQQLQYFALQQLILQQVILQTVNKMRFSVNPQQVEEEIRRIPAFQEQGKFSQQKFSQLLSNNGMTPNAFIQNMTASLLLSQLSAGIQNSAFVTPSEVERAYGLLQQQRSFGYFVLPSASFISSAHPTDQQINDYYQQHKEQFRTPEQVKVAYLLLSPGSLKAQVKVNPDEAQQFYQEHSTEFAGKSFSDVRSSIEQRLAAQQLNQLLAAKSEQLQDLTYTNPGSLSEAAKALDLPVKDSEWMSRQGLKDDPIFSDPKVLTAVFSDEVMKQNSNSSPIELKEGSFVVARIAERRPSQDQSLAAVSESIKQQLQKEQGQKQAGLQAYEIQQALEKGEPVDSVAKRYHLAWVTKADVTRQDKALSPSLLAEVFNLTPSADPAHKAVTSSLQANGDYFIIQLNNVQNADYHHAAADEQKKIQAGLIDRWGEIDYQLFAKSALEKAKVKNQG
jgi:peptidyl-prolyl cis-trans isomerase D